jgi:hypothetical protein
VSISVVNGYLCMSSCDAAKARTGQDPHASNATSQADNAEPDASQTAAVTFGGSLTGLNAVAPTGAAAQSEAANGKPSQASIDIRA